MTVSSAVSHVQYAGNGVTKTFAAPFYFLLNSDIAVQISDASGNITDLVYGTNYSVTGAGNAGGGSVTLNVAYATGYTILVYRAPPLTQETVYYENGKFPAKSHEKALDKLTMLIQQQGWIIDSLTLKKPTFLAKYYDAKMNRIANMGDPVNAQDATTKSYVDAVDGNLQSQISANFQRSIRVPEASVSQLPNVDQRRNKLLAMDDSGNPMMVLPQSGSASDVLIELAKADSTVIIAGQSAPFIANNAVKTKHLERDQDVYDIFITYGQSNSAGEAILSGSTSGFPAPLERSLMYDFTDGTIKPIIQGIVSTSGVASSGHAWGEFANEWYRKSGRGAVIVHCGRGATSLAQLSKGAATGGSDFYGMLVSGVTAARARMAVQGLPVGKTFTLFHQGETDQNLLTTFDTYRQQLIDLIANLQADAAIDLFANFTVGSPLNRPEYAWATIQNCQRYVCCGRDVAVTAFDGCPSFLLRDGNVGTEGVHYTQKGYNLMGREGARGLWSLIGAGSANKTQPDLAQYNQWVAPWSRAKHFSSVIRWASSTNKWAILNKSNDTGTWRPANVSDVNTAADGNSLEFTVGDNARSWFSLSAQISRALHQQGLTVTAETFNEGVLFRVRAVLFADVEVLINTVTGEMRSGKPSAILSGWLSRNISIVVNSPGTVTLTHGTCTSYPQVSYYASADGAFKFGNTSLFCPDSATTKVYCSVTVNDQNPWVNVMFRKMLIKPDTLSDAGGSIFVQGIYAPEF